MKKVIAVAATQTDGDLLATDLGRLTLTGGHQPGTRDDTCVAVTGGPRQTGARGEPYAVTGGTPVERAIVSDWGEQPEGSAPTPTSDGYPPEGGRGMEGCVEGLELTTIRNMKDTYQTCLGKKIVNLTKKNGIIQITITEADETVKAVAGTLEETIDLVRALLM